ncbi:XdhC family protein [Luteimonas fraxinea]|uniref:XdhC family protein n=1 Tax=Luteimonas fraxinea TaxID=2901869 RepID=A0ABS8UGV4_9GAMM|nr:XdhC/CoxI family protein [Luteimonas fraxinea]MCD9098730.1 XdhC family protein [Luteimonas fraxinea]MCD9125570.1 XdhC family protein [Luteimonas fraxinea]UHH10386.1 XdhC family protein [Luteimonas fraxinea]
MSAAPSAVAACSGKRHIPAPGFAEGNPGAVLQAASDALSAGRAPVLALVVETEGSTYASIGALALFGDGPHVGWISGGCLEPEIERVARVAGDAGRLEWLDIDTTDDDALFSGSAVGCRGRQVLALLPLAAMPQVADAIAAWRAGGQALAITLERTGRIACRLDGRAWSWTLPVGEAPQTTSSDWTLTLQRAPEALILGAGPETPTLIPMLRSLGWRVIVAERRARWRDAAAPHTDLLDLHPEAAVAAHPHADVALVMHHGFESDRDALAALAGSRIPFIGLLGPQRRRDDLFKLLRPAEREALSGRLRSPVGIPHCGRGPEAIALSIATQLQQWRGAR